MRDEQVRRYARHILLPDVGGLGQTALLVATVRIDVSTPAGMIAATYLAAAGVGTVVVGDAADPSVALLSNINPDSKIVREPTETRAIAVAIPPTPLWWPSSPHDATARAFWSGAIAATACVAHLIDR